MKRRCGGCRQWVSHTTLLGDFKRYCNDCFHFALHLHGPPQLQTKEMEV